MTASRAPEPAVAVDAPMETQFEQLPRVIEEVTRQLDARGWAYVANFQREDDGGTRLLALASALGDVFVSDEPSGNAVIETRCDCDASECRPFDRSEAIGWHNDFSTWTSRPALSFAVVRAEGTRAGSRGDWRVASCADVIATLRENESGRRALLMLCDRDLPFCFATDEPVVPFRVVQDADAGLARFYRRALRLGVATSPVRGGLEAVEAWEQAADRVGRVLAATAGALLVCDNWRAMHDRLEQSAGRRSTLAFVGKRHARARHAAPVTE